MTSDQSYNEHERQNKYLPNSFQTPNAVIDELMPYLTSNETVVLMYTIRHIYGWTTRITHRQHNISLDAFENGYTANENKVHYPGCGLSRDAIITALAGLVEHGVLVKGKRTIHGQIWEIGFDRVLNLDSLKARRAAKEAQGRLQLAKARAVNPQITGKSAPQTNSNQSVPQTDNQSVPQTNGKSVPQTNRQSVPQTKGSLSHRPNRNALNPLKPIDSVSESIDLESRESTALSPNKSKSFSEKLREKGVGVGAAK